MDRTSLLRTVLPLSLLRIAPGIAAALCVGALAGCSDDDSTPAEETPADDAGVDAPSPGDDAATEEDADDPATDTVELLDVDSTTPRPGREIEACDDGGLILAWSLVERAAPSLVTTTAADGITTATLDASAGGMNEARNNPFVYLDLDDGVQLLVDDYAALDDARWELAFRRTALRTNSGHSGPGRLELGRLTGTTLEAVTSADTVPEWEIDESFGPQCVLYADPLGSPLTAINYLNGDNPSGSESWYSYEGGVSPMSGHVYVVRGTDGGGTFAFTIDGWTSGVYTLRWKSL